MIIATVDPMGKHEHFHMDGRRTALCGGTNPNAAEKGHGIRDNICRHDSVYDAVAFHRSCPECADALLNRLGLPPTPERAEIEHEFVIDMDRNTPKRRQRYYPFNQWGVLRHDDFDDIDGCGKNLREQMKATDFPNIRDIMVAEQADIASVPGIGHALAARMKADVGKLDRVEVEAMSGDP